MLALDAGLDPHTRALGDHVMKDDKTLPLFSEALPDPAPLTDTREE